MRSNRALIARAAPFPQWHAVRGVGVGVALRIATTARFGEVRRAAATDRADAIVMGLRDGMWGEGTYMVMNS